MKNNQELKQKRLDKKINHKILVKQKQNKKKILFRFLWFNCMNNKFF